MFSGKVNRTETLNRGRANSASMSSPPPGGPQTPPPSYPPQYPQQYPPQQPYYAQPAAPPPKKSNTALIVVLVVVVVVVVVAVMAWWVFTSLMAPVNNAQNVTVTGVSWTVDYPGSVSYFGTSPLTTCSACPIHATIYSPFNYILSLTNSDSSSHNVTDITLSGFQFTIVSTTPTITSGSPLVFTAGQTRSITLSIQVTPLTGNGVMTGTITTT